MKKNKGKNFNKARKKWFNTRIFEWTLINKCPYTWCFRNVFYRRKYKYFFHEVKNIDINGEAVPIEKLWNGASYFYKIYDHIKSQNSYYKEFMEAYNMTSTDRNLFVVYHKNDDFASDDLLLRRGKKKTKYGKHMIVKPFNLGELNSKKNGTLLCLNMPDAHKNNPTILYYDKKE